MAAQDLGYGLLSSGTRPEMCTRKSKPQGKMQFSQSGEVSAGRIGTLLLQGSYGWHKKSRVCSCGNKSRSIPGKRWGSSPMHHPWLLSETRTRAWQVLAGGQADQCLTQLRKCHTRCRQTLPCQPGACDCHTGDCCRTEKLGCALLPLFLAQTLTGQWWQQVTSATTGQEAEIPSSACICLRENKKSSRNKSWHSQERKRRKTNSANSTEHFGVHSLRCSQPHLMTEAK